MLYRTLGSTGLRVSVIGLGTWQLGGEWAKSFEQSEVDAMFDAAREEGITLIDTAECYGDHLSEQFIGKAIERDRSQWIVATKFGHKYHGFLDRTEPRSPADVRQQTIDSLRALRTDYVDLTQYHSWGDDQFFDDDVLAELHKLKDEGKVRHLGTSISKNDNVKQTGASAARGLETIQVVYNRLDRTPESTTFPICLEQHLGVLARVPLASGLLSGKYKPGDTFEQQDPRAKTDPAVIQKKLSEVVEIAKTLNGIPMAEWALAWCLQHDAVTCVIPGCKSVEQVRANARGAKHARVDHPQATA
jgi:myo-inositol catabolism protein IolS